MPVERLHVEGAVGECVGDVGDRRAVAEIRDDEVRERSGNRVIAWERVVLREPEEVAEWHAGARFVAELAALCTRQAAVDFVEVSPFAAGERLKRALVLPVDEIRYRATALVREDEAVKLAAHHDAGGVGRAREQLLEQGARCGDDRMWIEFAEPWGKSADRRGKRDTLDVLDRERVEIEDGTFDEARAEIDGQVAHPECYRARLRRTAAAGTRTVVTPMWTGSAHRGFRLADPGAEAQRRWRMRRNAGNRERVHLPPAR